MRGFERSTGVREWGEPTKCYMHTWEICLAPVQAIGVHTLSPEKVERVHEAGPMQVGRAALAVWQRSDCPIVAMKGCRITRSKGGNGQSISDRKHGPHARGISMETRLKRIRVRGR